MDLDIVLDQFRDHLEQAKRVYSLDDGSLLGLAFGTVVIVAFTFRLLIKAILPSHKAKKNQNSKKNDTLTEKAAPLKPATPPAQSINTVATTKGAIPSTQVTESQLPAVSPKTDKLPLPIISPPQSPTSPEVLHAGPLKKRTFLSSSLNSMELYKEDDKSIALFYASPTGSPGSSPRAAKRKSSLYLASESFIEVGTRTTFTVHQLKNGGKKLKLEAKNIEERDNWVKKIQSAIDSLKIVRG